MLEQTSQKLHKKLDGSTKVLLSGMKAIYLVALHGGSWMSASAPVVIAPVELIVVFYKDEWKKTLGSLTSDITDTEFKEWTCGMWSFNGESKKKIGHPAPFPKELPYRCIKLFSYVNDVVFDPFTGSGTTLIVAKNTGRVGIGLEIDKSYCELAKNRIIEESEGFEF